MLWLTRPQDTLSSSLRPLFPRVPEKYRVSLDVNGYNPDSIKTEVRDGKLIVSGSEGGRHDSDDFSM